MAERTKEKPNMEAAGGVVAPDTADMTPAERKRFEKEAEQEAKRLAKEEKARRGKKGHGGLIALVFVLLLIGGFAAVVALNLFGVRTALVNDVLMKIPIVNNLITPEPVEGEEEGPTAAELQAALDKVNKQAEVDAAEIERLSSLNAMYLKEIDRLTDFETRQLQYKEDKEAFDRMITAGDLAAYAAFYENVDPVNAEAIYREYAKKSNMTKEMRDYVNTFTAMDESNAAAGLEQMAGGDPELVVRILMAMDSESRGLIMNEMTVQAVANLGRRMAPEEEIVVPE